MTSYQFTLMRGSIHRNPLDQIVSILISSNCTKVSAQLLWDDSGITTTRRKESKK